MLASISDCTRFNAPTGDASAPAPWITSPVTSTAPFIVISAESIFVAAPFAIVNAPPSVISWPVIATVPALAVTAPIWTLPLLDVIPNVVPLLIMLPPTVILPDANNAALAFAAFVIPPVCITVVVASPIVNVAPLWLFIAPKTISPLCATAFNIAAFVTAPALIFSASIVNSPALLAIIPSI